MKIQRIKRTTPILLTTLVISIFMLFFSASISYKQFQSITISEKLVIHSHEVIQKVQELLSYVKDAEASQRGYLLTKDTIFLKPYTNASNNAKLTIDMFKSLAENDTKQKKNIDSIEYLINERFNMSATVLQKEDIDLPLSDLNKSKLLSRKKLMDKIHNKTKEIIELEAIKLKTSENHYSEKVGISPLTFFFTTIFSLIVFIGAFYKIYRDIKTLNNANNQLLINKELFGHNEAIAKTSSWFWDIEESKLVYSDNQYRLLGCEPNEFEPSIENFLKFVHPEDRHIIIDGEQKVNKDFTSSISYFRVIRKDREIRYFKSLGKIITDTYGKNIAIGINADITYEYLANKILEEKLFDLERSNKELLSFNHVASHDLQEPLRKIQTFISRINANEMDLMTENGKTYFSRIKVAANRMQKLIDDLLAFSRTNKADQAFELADLNLLLENSKQELTEFIEEKQVIINATLLPTLMVIPFQIQQLFTNLIGNALKYSKPNSLPIITINSEIVCGKDVIKSSFTNENKLYKISISDNGIGFEEKYAEEIFTLFNRLHNDSEYSGTGIGLTICKKIVENHKGFIKAEGIPNVGSRFNIFIPV